MHRRWRTGSWLCFNCANACASQPKFLTCQKFIQPSDHGSGTDDRPSLPPVHCTAKDARRSGNPARASAGCASQKSCQIRSKIVQCILGFRELVFHEMEWLGMTWNGIPDNSGAGCTNWSLLRLVVTPKTVFVKTSLKEWTYPGCTNRAYAWS